MASLSRPSNGRRPDRTLRIITIVAFVPALALLIPSGVVTARPLPAIGLVPMAMSLVVSMAALASKKSSSRMRPMADSIVAVSLMIVMVFSWITIAENYWLSAGSAMLCAYGIVPMMVNFCIHTYLALRALPSFFEPEPCPNCDYTPPSKSLLPRWQRQHSHVALPTEDPDDQENDQEHAARHPQVQIVSRGGGPGHSRSVKEIYQPPFSERAQGDEDANARESSEFQTSGFNTPRQSAETLESERRVSSEGSEETVRRDGKGVESLV
ncbi:hypothetical protein Q7P36_008622 [Cladosporium allicinum]